jgi:hypothetical protein
MLTHPTSSNPPTFQSSRAAPLSSHRPACSTTPPASRTMISAAAVSHSQQGTMRGYIWAEPSATMSSFRDDPTCESEEGMRE